LEEVEPVELAEEQPVEVVTPPNATTAEVPPPVRAPVLLAPSVSPIATEPTTIKLSNTDAENAEDTQTDTTYSKGGGIDQNTGGGNEAGIVIAVVLLLSFAILTFIVIFIRRRRKFAGRDPESVPELMRRVSRFGRPEARVEMQIGKEGKPIQTQTPILPQLSFVTAKKTHSPAQRSKKLAPKPSPLSREMYVESITGE
jgi:hypothetical protein